MTDRSPASQPAVEVESSVTLQDFFGVFYRFRIPFLIGLVLLGVVTLVWTKFFRMKYYRAATDITIGEPFSTTSLAGIADTQLFEPNRSDKFLVNATLFAERTLYSQELILEVTRRLAQPGDGTEASLDVYELLRIRESDPQRREAILVKQLSEDLLKVIQLQNSGVIELAVELPDPVASARFANAAIAVLKDRFADYYFSYIDKLADLYRQDLAQRLVVREQLAQEMLKLQREHHYDTIPTIQARRDELRQQLDLQAEALGELNVQISQLALATSPEARDAAQRVHLISQAYPPLEKSRPKTVITTIMVLAVYTFVFVLVMVGTGYARVRGRLGPDGRAPQTGSIA